LYEHANPEPDHHSRCLVHGLYGTVHVVIVTLGRLETAPTRLGPASRLLLTSPQRMLIRSISQICQYHCRPWSATYDWCHAEVRTGGATVTARSTYAYGREFWPVIARHHGTILSTPMISILQSRREGRYCRKWCLPMIWVCI